MTAFRTLMLVSGLLAGFTAQAQEGTGRAALPTEALVRELANRVWDADAADLTGAVIGRGAEALPALAAALEAARDDRARAILVQATASILMTATMGAASPPAPESVATALVTALSQTTDDSLRGQILMALSLVGTSARPALERLTHDLAAARDDAARAAPVEAISALMLGASRGGREPEVPPATVAALTETLRATRDPSVRRAVVVVLGFAGPAAAPAADALLAALAAEDDAAARIGIVRALGGIGPSVVGPVSAAIVAADDDRVRADLALVVRGQPVPPETAAALVESLGRATDDDARSQLAGVVAAIEPPPPGAAEALAKALVASEGQVPQSMILSALSEVGVTAAAVPALRTMLTTAREETSRRHAAILLAEAGPDGVAALLAALRDGDPAARRQAARTLGTIEPTTPGIVDGLVAAVSSAQEEDGRREAAMALVAIGDPAVGAVEAAAKATSDDAARRSLQVVLQMIAGR